MQVNLGTFTGGKAVAVLLLFVAFSGYRWMSARDALNSEGRQYLEEWIALELQRPILADTTRSVGERGEAVLAAGNVRIRSMSSMGPLGDMVVKVELEPSPDLPPGTELVRYYRLEYGTFTGWQHRGNLHARSQSRIRAVHRYPGISGCERWGSSAMQGGTDLGRGQTNLE